MDSVAVGESVWICSGQCGSGRVCVDLERTVWQWDSLSGFAVEVCQWDSLCGFTVDSVVVAESVWIRSGQCGSGTVCLCFNH